MKKIYIAGCAGMLGEAFYRHFKDDYILKCTDKNVTDEWISPLDFRNFKGYADDVIDFKPDWLFHLGAYTDLEYCENNPGETFITNTLAVENAVRIANFLDIPILYISTAGIFDGNKSCYDDWDTPNPIGIYARSKYGGERYVIENAKRFLICRAGWMMGGGPAKDKKFINKIMKQVNSGAKEIYIVNDKDGTPTYTHDFALTVKGLIENDFYGLYNCVCEGQTSRMEIAQEMLNILGLSIDIFPVSSNYFKNEYFAPRPPCERLINTRLNYMGMNKMRNWKICLREYLTEYFEKNLK